MVGTRRVWWAAFCGVLAVGCGQTRKNGEEPQADAPVEVPVVDGPSCAVTLASDGAGYCAAYEDGSVWCWGTDPEPKQVELPGKVSQLFMGSGNTCAAISGKLHCWGNNAQRQLRDEPGAVEAPIAVELGTTFPVMSAAIDAQQLCVIDQLFHVTCRGGALASPTQVDVGNNEILTMPGPGTEILDSAGRIFSLADPQRPDLLDALDDDNAAFLAGFNGPVCLLKRAGSLWCSGYVLDEPTPIRAKVALGESVTSAAVGDLSICALTDSGRVWCEGWNGVGQAGRGTTDAFAEGDYVPDVQDVLELVVARTSACALRVDGSVWCWGTYAPSPPSIAPHEVTGCQNQSETLPRTARMAPRSSARLSQAGEARSQALCECALGADAPDLEACMAEETSAPNAACIDALAPNLDIATSDCLAESQWQDALCFDSSARCGGGVVPADCVPSSTCTVGTMAPILNHCARRHCPVGGKPIGPRRLCDGTVDCEDGSDERNCTYGQTSFDCGDGTMIPIPALCDDVVDCENEADESGCR